MKRFFTGLLLCLLFFNCSKTEKENSKIINLQHPEQNDEIIIPKTEITRKKLVNVNEFPEDMVYSSSDYLATDIFEFQMYFYRHEALSQYWDRRYRYTFENGLLVSIETSYSETGQGIFDPPLSDKIKKQNIVTIKRYDDRMEAYKNDELYFTLYYSDRNDMYYVRAIIPTIKGLITVNNDDIIIYRDENRWLIKITRGREITFRFNYDNSYPWVDFTVTVEDPARIRYGKPLKSNEDIIIYEMIGEEEYDRVTYRDGKRWFAQVRYIAIPASGKYQFSFADLLVDYICGEHFEHLFWGQLIIRSENRLSGLLE